MEDKIKDLEYHIKSLQEQINFKDDLLDKYFEMFKEIYKRNYNINDIIIDSIFYLLLKFSLEDKKEIIEALYKIIERSKDIKEIILNEFFDIEEEI